MLGPSAKIAAFYLMGLFYAIQPAQGETGYLQGFVLSWPSQDTLIGIPVRLDYLGSDDGVHRTGVTSDNGQFHFNDLPVGYYSISADVFGHGFAGEVIQIVPRTTTFITLLLEVPYLWDEYLPSITLRGRVAIANDSLTATPHYYLDVGADGTPDYRLVFGPPWYDSPAVQRPASGQRVWITGGLFSYSDPPMIIVHFINNAFWRDSTDHGGAGGAQQQGMGCPIDDYQRIECEGRISVRQITPPPQDSTVYLFSSLDDSLIALLDFGDNRYHPEGGTSKPTADGPLYIMGGFYDCALSPLPHIIVYEMNGQFWREPGDTCGFGWMDLDVPEITPSHPMEYLIVSNYPNPFNAATNISLNLPRTGYVELEIYNVIGRKQSIIYHGLLTQGSYTFQWNALDHPSGLYFCRAFWNSQSAVRQMLLIR